MKILFYKYLSRFNILFILALGIISLKYDLLRAEDSYLDDMEINNSTKTATDSSLPSNPFEIVEMIRRANSLNDATKPSEAIDEALKSFDMITEKK